MSEQTESANKPETEKPEDGNDGQEPVPFMQRLLDNPFLLLFIGVATPAVLYLMWGIMEVAQIPLAQ